MTTPRTDYPHSRHSSKRLIRWLAQAEIQRRAYWEEYKQASDAPSYLYAYSKCLYWANFGWECCAVLTARGFSKAVLDDIIEKADGWARIR